MALCLSDSTPSRGEAGGAAGTPGGGVCQAALCGLAITHPAPYRGQHCHEGLAWRRLSTAACATVFTHGSSERGGFAPKEFVIRHWDWSQREVTAAQPPLLLLLRALSLTGLPSPRRRGEGDAACLGELAAFRGIPGKKDFQGKQSRAVWML